MTSYDLDVVVTRGDIRESRHRVHAAVVGASGDTLGVARDADLVTCWRSCAKPFQAMPLVESGQIDRLGWGEDELALACASHGGEPEHAALAERMLGAVGLEEGDLACGPHEPLTARGMRLLRQSGGRPTRLHNNCSGKHAAMLVFAKLKAWPTLGYERRGHEVQERALESVARWSGVPREKVLQSVDGCGVVAFGLPLRAMALAFARFGAAAQRGEEPAARVAAAMRGRPLLVGGTDRFDTILLEETGGDVICKVGAEGVHAVAVPGVGIGFAVKAEDGAARAQYAAVLRLLQHLGVLSTDLAPRLAAFLRPSVVNTRGEVVGQVLPVD